MTRACLLYNPRSGRAEDERAIVRALRDAGLDIRGVHATLDEALAGGPELVVVAGGDGTVGRAAKRVAGTGVAIAVLPTGTANNIARSLGVEGTAEECARALADAECVSADLGTVACGGQEQTFVEAFGLGVFANVMGARATSHDKRLCRAHELIADELERYAVRETRVEIDGRDFSAEYLVAAVLNGQTVGPALCLAPGARVDDGELDVVLVPPEHRADWIARLRASSDDSVALPPHTTQRARRVRIEAPGRWAHTDDIARELDGVVEVGVKPAAVRFMVPRTRRALPATT